MRWGPNRFSRRYAGVSHTAVLLNEGRIGGCENECGGV